MLHSVPRGPWRTYTQLVRLMIVDEVHLLHDHRPGPPRASAPPMDPTHPLSDHTIVCDHLRHHTS